MFFAASLLICAISSAHALTGMYVANENSNTLSVINTTTRAVEDTVNTASQPLALAWDGATGIYEASFGANRVQRFSTLDGSSGPSFFIFAPRALAWDGATGMYAASYSQGHLSVIDTTTQAIGATLAVGSNPIALAWDGGNGMYVASGNSVQRIDTATLSVGAPIVVAPTISIASLAWDGATGLYVGSNTNTINRISLTDQSIGPTLSATGPNFINAQAMAWDGDSEIYVADAQDALVFRINTSGGSGAFVGDPIPVGNFPAALAWDGDSTMVVANFFGLPGTTSATSGGGQIQIIDLSTHIPSLGIAVGSGPIALTRVGDPPTRSPSPPSLLGLSVPAGFHNANATLLYLQSMPLLSPDFAYIVEQLCSLDPPNPLAAALDQLHPAQFGAFDLLNATMSQQISSILARARLEACASCCKMSLWTHPYGYFTSEERVGEMLGFEATGVGILSGLNFCLPQGFLFGVAGGYGANSIEWDHQRGRGTFDASSLALYTDWTHGIGSLQASLIGSWDAFKGGRHIEFAQVSRHARHSQGGYNLTAHLGGDAAFAAGKFSLKPFGLLDYFYLYQQSFTETGADSLNLHVLSRHSSWLRSELGLSATRSFQLGSHSCFSPILAFSGINECELGKKGYVSSLMGQSATFSVSTYHRSLYFFSPSLELLFSLSPSFNLSARYAAEVNAHVVTQKLDGRLQYKF